MNWEIWKKVFYMMGIFISVVGLSLLCLQGGNYVFENIFHFSGIFLTICQFILLAFVIIPAKFCISYMRDHLFE